VTGSEQSQILRSIWTETLGARREIHLVGLRERHASSLRIVSYADFTHQQFEPRILTGNDLYSSQVISVSYTTKYSQQDMFGTNSGIRKLRRIAEFGCYVQRLTRQICEFGN